MPPKATKAKASKSTKKETPSPPKSAKASPTKSTKSPNKVTKTAKPTSTNKSAEKATAPKTIPPKKVVEKNEIPTVKKPASKKPKKQLLTVEQFLSTQIADYILTCGNGDTGQLGHGEDVTVCKRPRNIKTFSENVRFLQAVAGGMHSVVLTSKYEVFTSGCNDEGALGRPCLDDDGAEVDKDEDFLFRKVVFPENCGDLIMISAGDSHTAALTRSGSVFIWGTFRDKGGVLGLASSNNRKSGQVMQKTKEPYLLSSTNDRVVVKIASGSNHIAMLTNDGKILTSGAGDAGQLGRLTPHSRDSSISHRTVMKMMSPQEINVKKSLSFVDLWCATYCCFARAIDNRIFIWGLNNYRQLGVTPDDPEKMDVHFPISSERFVSTKIWKDFAGDHHILAADDSGTCYGIGRGDDCRLGMGEENTASSETLIEIRTANVVGVAAATGTSFLWDKEGHGFAWGANNEAELGLGVEEGDVVEKPREIEIRSIQGGCRIVQISANAQHTVFLACRMDGNRIENGNAAA